MGTFVSRSGRWFFSTWAVSILSFVALVFMWCGEEPGNSLVGDGEAWIDNAIGMTGYVFRGDGKVQALSAVTMSANSWVVSSEADYYLDGDKVNIAGIPYTFNVSGSTLTLHLTVSGITSSVRYTKKAGLMIVPMDEAEAIQLSERYAQAR